MKKEFMLIVIILCGLFAACNNTNITEEGLVNFPENTTLIPFSKINLTSSSLIPSTTTTQISTISVKPTTTTILAEEEKLNAKDDEQIIEINEGDYLKLNLKATDPDNNLLTYTFSSPLNEKGEWQTKIGDAGNYNVIVTATDGKLETTKKIKITVKGINNEPYIVNFDQIKEITVNEGETITINPNIIDKDGDQTTVKYSGYMSGNSYKTNFNDAGTYYVNILISDGKTEVTKIIKVNILNKNRQPTLELIPEQKTITEGDTVKVEAKASDLDGDAVAIVFNKPLDQNGVWTTKIGDSGDYQIKVSASDKESSVSKEFKLEVLSANKAPIIEQMADITVKEGQTVILNPKASDPDGDDITISYSGWMKSNVYVTGYDDSGTHKVTITASDGKTTATKDVTINVIDQNRPPENLVVEVTITPGNK